ncbi:MAG: RNA polymerase sigma factor [Acidimicrobiales bacterium]
MGELSDEALLAGIAVRDESATIAFVRRYQRRVYGLAVSIIGDPRGAEDVAQEAFLRVWRHAQMFDPRRGSGATWVLAITRNLAIDSMRVRKAAPIDPVRLMALETLSSDSPEDALSDVGKHPELETALGALPVEQRRALLLSVVLGLSASQIAHREAIPLGTAKTRIRAALQKLRSVLDVGKVGP